MVQPGDEQSDERRDPFRTDASPPPARDGGSTPPGTGNSQGPSPEARRTALRLAAVSVLGVGCAFFLPPLGVVIGVVAIVLAVRGKGVVPPRPRVLGLVSGSVAVVVGIALSGVLLFFSSELVEYVRCDRAANTVQAQQNCQDALNESLASRLGL